MKIKRILALLLAVVMVLALVACSNSTTDPTGKPAESGKTPEGTNAPVNPDDIYEMKVKLWVPDVAVDITKK